MIEHMKIIQINPPKTDDNDRTHENNSNTILTYGQ